MQAELYNKTAEVACLQRVISQLETTAKENREEKAYLERNLENHIFGRKIKKIEKEFEKNIGDRVLATQSDKAGDSYSHPSAFSHQSCFSNPESNYQTKEPAVEKTVPTCSQEVASYSSAVSSASSPSDYRGQRHNTSIPSKRTYHRDTRRNRGNTSHTARMEEEIVTQAREIHRLRTELKENGYDSEITPTNNNQNRDNLCLELSSKTKQLAQLEQFVISNSSKFGLDLDSARNDKIRDLETEVRMKNLQLESAKKELDTMTEVCRKSPTGDLTVEVSRLRHLLNVKTSEVEVLERQLQGQLFLPGVETVTIHNEEDQTPTETDDTGADDTRENNATNSGFGGGGFAMEAMSEESINDSKSDTGPSLDQIDVAGFLKDELDKKNCLIEELRSEIDYLKDKENDENSTQRRQLI
eukprot:Platyproteum_vivax@DN10762_c0_g1_i1.p1